MADEVQKKSRNPDDHSVFIGGKPFMNYVTGVVMQFTTQDAKEVIIKARGKFISRAVDVAEVVRKRFLENQVDLGNISIESEEFENKEGRQVRVSTIEITLAKKQ
ncbi:MAG: DNA-binding protein Alba [Nanoarchaeota archaeon]|nr:DNA-binding protein Alba [Nanoarchaeota archaeon]MCG2718938.1 DNA-binding protein Alba [Nanoarchaeota archaeon]